MTREKSLIEKFKRINRENLKTVLFFVVMTPILLIIFFASFIYGLIAVAFKEVMLKSLIEAEATIIGFFGIIATYSLASIDNRIDKLEDKKFEFSSLAKKEELKVIDKRIKQMEKRESLLIIQVVWVGIYLIVALLLSILALGIPDNLLSFYICVLGMGMFFTGILGIFWILYETPKREKGI